ncbi:MAG: Gfo/Idh/MocA family oxidoreductase [Clostridia bacterium]|nr:Gfo/Idh/MocA family oxidoreductase [Clostridia bacterium]
MDFVRLGIIGLGNMGSGHIGNYLAGRLKNVKITAICDIDPEKLAAASEKLGSEVKTFATSEELIRSGEVDAILIATPHYFHPTIAIDGFKNGLHVLSEKPAGVYTKAVREMNEVAEKSGKVFGLMFNQRTNPAYQKLKEMMDTGVLGEMTRATWIITDWYRTQAYYNSGGWRATWAGEGGGVLLNQCPHQIDLMQWICGVPKRVFAQADFGMYHDIEVEDNVTAVYEYENGAKGLFVTTTGEYPGTNRFEVSGDLGKVVIEHGKFTYYKNNGSVKANTMGGDNGFGGLSCEKEEIVFDNGGEQHVGILNNFVDCILNGTPLLAPGVEGIRGLTVSNAMHLSAWTGGWVDVPFDEDKFYDILKEKIETSRYVKPETTSKAAVDISNTYGNK